MKIRFGKSFLFFVVCVSSAALLFAGVASTNDGQTVPQPIFQLGDNPSIPLPEGHPELLPNGKTKGEELIEEFIKFYNQTYLKGNPDKEIPATPIRLLNKEEIVWFPPQSDGDTSLELVLRHKLLDGKNPSANCNPDDGSYPPEWPGGYPLVCDENEFSTAQFCQACHESALYVEGGGLPEMMYISKDEEPKGDKPDEHSQWLANWSQYGDWSASIMRLATRDPIWQAQIETETNQHPYADPAVIQDVCFSCHGEMGERQLKTDFGEEQKFCTDMFYATVPGYLSELTPGIVVHL